MNLSRLLFLISLSLLFVRCSESVEEDQPTKDKISEKKIQSIEIDSYGSQQYISFNYNDNGSVDVNYAAVGANVSMHIEYNDHKQITEMISGGGRTRNQFGPGGTRIGTTDAHGGRIEYSYDSKNRPIRQYSIENGDTLCKYFYEYTSDDVAASVTSESKFGTRKKYALTYGDEKNPLRENFEMVFPGEHLYRLGNVALYAPRVLLKATLVEVENEPSLESGANLLEFQRNDIEYRYNWNADGSCSIRLLNDHERNWSAKISIGSNSK